MQTITYDAKSYINENPSVPASNKVQASDMNEIKNVVNANANATHKWVSVGDTTGTTSLTLPQDFNEILVVVKVANNDNVCITMVIPENTLYNTAHGFNGGYYAGNINAHVRVLGSLTSISLSIATLNNSNVLSTSTMEVYYR